MYYNNFELNSCIIYCITQTAYHKIKCMPIKEKTVAIENGENGIAVATVIEKCQCVYPWCYRKSYYEKYREVDSREEVVWTYTHIHTHTMHARLHTHTH